MLMIIRLKRIADQVGIAKQKASTTDLATIKEDTAQRTFLLTYCLYQHIPQAR